MIGTGQRHVARFRTVPLKRDGVVIFADPLPKVTMLVEGVRFILTLNLHDLQPGHEIMILIVTTEFGLHKILALH